MAKAWFRLGAGAGAAAVVLMLALPAQAQGTADLIDRIQRLEAQIRSLNGQLEQSQFRVRQMEDQQRRMQADIEFRLNELENARGGARPAQQPRPPQQQQQQQPQRRGDVFDPSEQQAA
ncbi:MAG: YbgF trimerization domain-containing protein, partial [Phreatobacter sp.]